MKIAGDQLLPYHQGDIHIQFSFYFDFLSFIFHLINPPQKYAKLVQASIK